MLTIPTAMQKFEPHHLPGLKFWGRHIKGLSEDAAIASPNWIDYSGNGATVTSATAAQQPVWSTDIFKKGGMLYDATNDCLSSSNAVFNALPANSGFTCYAVLRPNLWNTPNGRMIFVKNNSALTSGCLFYIGRVASDGSTLRLIYYQNFTTTAGSWITAAVMVPSKTYLVTMTYKASGVGNDPVIYVNRASKSLTENSTPVGTPRNSTTVNLTVGNLQDYSRPLSGYMDEMLIYKGIHSTANLNKVWDYLYANWKIDT